MAIAPSKSNSSRLTAIVSFAVALIALLAFAGTSSAADRGWTPTGDIQNVNLQVHNGLLAPDASDAEQFQVSVINYNSFAVNGKVAFYAVGADGKTKGKALAEGGFQLPADGPTTAIVLSSDKLIKLITGKKFKPLKVRAKVAFWTNGFTKLGKAEGKYTIVKKLKGAKGAANTLPTAANRAYTVKEGATLSGPILSLLNTATDADFDHLYLRVTQRPTHFKTFTIGADGIFSYVGAANFAGTDSFVYDIFDGTGYSTPVTVTITVTPKTPTIATIADQKVVHGATGTTFSLKSSVTSAVPVTAYELTGAPAGVSISAAGVVSNTNPWTSGTTTVTLKATNSAGTTSKTFKLVVIPAKVGSITNQSTVAGTTIAPLDVSASFASGVAFTGFTATGLPTGLTISSAGIISGTIDGLADFNSPFAVSITATDPNGTSAAQTFTWTVTTAP